MKLGLTLNDLERGSVLVGGSNDRKNEAMHSAKNRDPFTINPVRLRDGSKKIAAIAPTGEVNETARGPEIKFRPVWCKLFTVNSMPNNKLARIVCEFEHGKYMIDRAGARKVDLTLNGYGVDPSVAEAAEVEIASFLEQPRVGTIGDIIFQLITFIRGNF